MFREFLKRNLDSENKVTENSFGVNFISSMLLGLVILLPIFYLPLKFSALSAAKLTLVLSVVFVSVIVVLINLFKLGKINLSLNLTSVSIFLIIVSYTISTVFSQNPVVSFFGRDFSLDSWVTIISLFTLLCLFKHNIKKEHIMFALVGTILASGVISAVQILNIFLPTLPSLGIFYSSIATTLGKWNDLALFSTLGVVLTVLILEQIKITQRFKIILYLVSLLNIFFIILINFNLSFYILVGFGILFSVYKIFNHELTKNKIHNKNSRIPFISIGIATVSVVYLLLGTAVSQGVSLLLNIDHIEARPSIVTTYNITKLALSEGNTFFGSGPVSFEAQWPVYKPAEVLITDFWDLDFRYGTGVISSFGITTGILGIVVWVIFFVILLILFVKSLLFKNKDDYLKFIISSTAFATIILWIFTIFYITSTTLFVFAFIFTGMFLSVAQDVGLLKNRVLVLNRFITTFFVTTLIVIAVLLAYKTYTKFIGQVYFQKSVQIAVFSGDYNELEKIINKAQYFDNIDTYSRSLGEIYTARLFQILQTSSNAEVNSGEIQNLIQKITSSYEEAIYYDPNNYNNYFGLGNFYTSLVQYSIPNADQAALNTYAKVAVLKPLNPVLYLQMAKLASADDMVLAEELVRRAISIKPNYFDAISVLVQLELEDGDTIGALSILEEYLGYYPQDLEALFQTGLIYFETRNFNSAIKSFESLIQTNPNVQNAYYFLGLSYFEVGQTNKSIEQFEIISKANPGNVEIQSILQSLRSGGGVSPNQEN